MSTSEQAEDYLKGVNDERQRIRDGINMILDNWNNNMSAETVNMLIRIDGVVEGE